jgi:1-pyrroline-5-carboxylate dehydrogenase
MFSISKVPVPINEPVKTYLPNSPEKKEVKAMLAKLRSETQDIPMYIGSERVFTEKKGRLSPPYDHKHTLGHYSLGDADHVTQAINAALGAKDAWANLAWEHRAAIFLKAADLLATKYRAKINAATMLGQSKSIYQAEIDAACEMVDFCVSMCIL